jgi:hypothetical protein
VATQDPEAGFAHYRMQQDMKSGKVISIGICETGLFIMRLRDNAIIKRKQFSRKEF